MQVHERSEGDSFNGLYGYHDQMAAPVFLDQVFGFLLLPECSNTIVCRAGLWHSTR